MPETIAPAPHPAPVAEPATSPAPVSGPSAPGRLQSLDVFRGITVAGMLLVNNPGTWSAIYPPLAHAEWHGWTPTDLIFPFFLFIVGVAMAFSLLPAAERGTARGELMKKSVVRGIKLFGLGLLLAAFPFYTLDLAHLRIPGVLQRIGVAFVAASALVLFLKPRAQAWATAVLLLGYWAAMRLIPVPGYGAGNLGKDGNFAAYVDRAIIGTDHMWKSAKTWDPEGIFSTLPAIATVMLGVFAGRWLRSARPPAEKATGMFFAGNVALVAGLIWHAAFPINKNLWTSSYVVFTAGMALNFLAMCYWTVDVRGYQRWARPFLVFGVNAIAAFFLSGIMARILGLVKLPASPEPVALKTWIFDNAFASWLSPVNASLAFALCFVLFWIGVMEVLYRRRIFFKV
ncbi:MAG TPA: heparan-alpha-glucosaminide N-acetyltransferase domain-containing protein [Longimicrobium sp.]|jgi:predicted acyltransferase